MKCDCILRSVHYLWLEEGGGDRGGGGDFVTYCRMGGDVFC